MKEFFRATGTAAPSPRARRLLWGSLLAATAALGIAVAAQGRTLPPGTTLAGVPLGGLTPAAAREALDHARIPAPRLTVTAGGRSWQVDAGTLGWRLDTAASVRALSDAHGNTWQRSWRRFTGAPAPAAEPRVTVDPDTARAALDALTHELAAAPVDAAISFDPARRRYAVRPDRGGVSPDTQAAAAFYAANPAATQLQVPLVARPSAVQAGELQPHVDAGNRLIRPLTLRLQGGAQELTLSEPQVADLYWVRPGGIELDPATLATAVDRAEEYGGRSVRNARFVPRHGQLVPVAEQSGLKVDRERAVEALQAALLRPELRRVELPAMVVQPSLRQADLPDPASLSVLATGSSAYLGSSRERVTNVAVAARNLTGYVVPPGEEFSFLQAVGRITADNGFKGALVIAGGRTVEGIGGGVCQVSTTAFRALYSAGLPLLERSQHSYRVRWYEPQVGFEAAVYDPGRDLRFRNDTGGPLLIRAFNDPEKGLLVVRLYGQPQQRQVSVSPAVIVSRTPAPPARYLVNPALRPGQRRQVDWAADGYQLYLTRTITDAEGTRTEKLTTHYKPWQAVYEVPPAPAAPTAPPADQPARLPSGTAPAAPSARGP